MDGVTLMARCLDDQVVRGQLSAHYPQARIQQVGPRGRPPAHGRGGAGVERDPAGRRPRVPPSAHLPRRRPARPRLRPPHRPHGRALCPLRGGARGGAAAAALPGSRLVPGPPGQGPQAARHGAEGTRLHVPDQAPADGRHHDGRPRPGRSRRPQGLPVGAGRRDMEGGAPGDRRGPGAGRRRLGMAPLEEGPQARRGPAPDHGRRSPASPSTPSSRSSPSCPPGRGRSAPGSFSGGSPPPTATSTTPQAPASRSARSGPSGPIHARPGDAPPGRPRRLFGGRSVRGGWASARPPACGTRRYPQAAGEGRGQGPETP